MKKDPLKKNKNQKGSAVTIFIVIMGIIALIAGILIAFSEEGVTFNGKNIYKRIAKKLKNTKNKKKVKKPVLKIEKNDQKITPQKIHHKPKYIKKEVIVYKNDSPNLPIKIEQNRSEKKPKKEKACLGKIKRVKEEDTKPKKPISIKSRQPTLPPKGKIAIIIDDFGNNWNTIEGFCSLDIPITLAVLPHLPYSKKSAQKAKEEGKEVILHLPLENNSQKDPGPGTIKIDMKPEEIKKEFEKNLKEVPGAIGFNNHEGSKGTENEKLMNEIMGLAYKHNLFFVDSRTSSKSVALDFAKRNKVNSTYRNVFLDNEDNVDYIKEQLKILVQKAQSNGKAIGIGHCRKNTLRAIKEMIPEIKEKKIKFICVSKMLN